MLSKRNSEYLLKPNYMGFHGLDNKPMEIPENKCYGCQNKSPEVKTAGGCEITEKKHTSSSEAPVYSQSWRQDTFMVVYHHGIVRKLCVMQQQDTSRHNSGKYCFS